MAGITEVASGFPGSNGRIPDECATVAELLQDGGYSNYMIFFKDYLAPGLNL